MKARNVYLAARYTRREELCGYRDQLRTEGIFVTGRWLNGSHQISDAGLPIGDNGESLVEDPDGDLAAGDEAARLRVHFAQEDVADMEAADLLIAFTEPPRASASRGGRHVELGYALGRGIPVVVVGPRENVFTWLPGVGWFETWDECFETLTKGLLEFGPKRVDRYIEVFVDERADSDVLVIDTVGRQVVARQALSRVTAALNEREPRGLPSVDIYDGVPF